MMSVVVTERGFRYSNELLIASNDRLFDFELRDRKVMVLVTGEMRLVRI